MIWKQGSSNIDGGTLYHLRNIINRRNVVKNPGKNMNACEGFLEVLIEAHVVSAALSTFEMQTVDDKPSEVFFPADVLKLNTLQ